MDIQKLYDIFRPCFRRKRARLLSRLFPTTKETTILDVGGHHNFWTHMNCPARITCLNLEIPDITFGPEHQVQYVQGDGRCLPYPDNSFDIAFSNSVIEHVGTHEDQERFASEIRRVGRRYWVQTPSRWFPVEPHLITPLIHYLPRKAQRHLLRRFTVWGLVAKPSREYIDGFLKSTRLLSLKQLKKLFPDGTIYKAKFLFLTKSFIVTG